MTRPLLLPLALTVGFTLACSNLAPKDHPVDDADRAVFLEADELIAALGLEHTVDPAAATWSKERSFDGTWEVEYSYEDDALFVQQTVFIDSTSSSAGTTYTGLKLGMAMAEGEDLQLVDAPQMLSWGGSQQCTRMVTEGIDIGVMCIARDGLTNLLVSFGGVGVGLEGKGAMTRLLGDRLTKLDGYAPSQAPEGN